MIQIISGILLGPAGFGYIAGIVRAQKERLNVVHVEAIAPLCLLVRFVQSPKQGFRSMKVTQRIGLNQYPTPKNLRHIQQIRDSKGFVYLRGQSLSIAKAASLTLAALAESAAHHRGRTFEAASKLAKLVHMPDRTFRRHLRELGRAGLIENRGRQNRRTVTYKVAPEVMNDNSRYPLPKFMLERPRAQQAVYAYGVYRAQVHPDRLSCWDSEAVIAERTGLSRPSVYYAIDALVNDGFLERTEHGFRFLPPPNVALPPPPEVVKKWPPSDRKSCKKVAGVRNYQESKYTWSKNAEGMDHKTISVEDISQIAERAFNLVGYTGAEGGNLWKLAGAVHFGLIAEGYLWDACEGARICQAKKRQAYVYTIIANRLEQEGKDLKEILRKVWITPIWPTEPPQPAPRPKSVAQDGSDRTQEAVQVFGHLENSDALGGRTEDGEKTDDTELASVGHGNGHTSSRVVESIGKTTGSVTTCACLDEPTLPLQPSRTRKEPKLRDRFEVKRWAMDHGKTIDWIRDYCQRHRIPGYGYEDDDEPDQTSPPIVQPRSPRPTNRTNGDSAAPTSARQKPDRLEVARYARDNGKTDDWVRAFCQRHGIDGYGYDEDERENRITECAHGLLAQLH